MAESVIAQDDGTAQPFKWRPIETAPKMELLWLYEPHTDWRYGGFMFAGLQTSNRGWINNLDLGVQNPSHWMPLPAPPSEVGE